MLRVGNIAVAMRTSWLASTGEFAAPVKYRDRKDDHFTAVLILPRQLLRSTSGHLCLAA